MKQKKIFHTIIATGFGSGYFPIAPGTAGAALAALLWFGISLVSSYTLLYIITFFLIVFFTFLGVWSAGIMEIYWGKDPSKVVVDEMVGMWIPLLSVSDGNVYYALVAFFLFRAFDIFKPLGIRKLEAIEGGWGIMLDDILAGMYSLLILGGLRWIIG